MEEVTYYYTVNFQVKAKKTVLREKWQSCLSQRFSELQSSS